MFTFWNVHRMCDLLTENLHELINKEGMYFESYCLHLMFFELIGMGTIRFLQLTNINLKVANSKMINQIWVNSMDIYRIWKQEVGPFDWLRERKANQWVDFISLYFIVQFAAQFAHNCSSLKRWPFHQ